MSSDARAVRIDGVRALRTNWFDPVGRPPHGFGLIIAPDLAKVQRALDEFGAPPASREELLTAEPLDVLRMGAPPARIDLMNGVPGGDFERAWRSRRLFHANGAPVSVINRQELMVLKRASGQPQDLVDATNLEKLVD